MVIHEDLSVIEDTEDKSRLKPFPSELDNESVLDVYDQLNDKEAENDHRSQANTQKKIQAKSNSKVADLKMSQKYDYLNFN